jgi:hypothetical protein
MQHTRPWNYYSVVDCCPTCEGAGVVHAHRPATINDPYPENACPDCDGEHEPECEVCGSHTIVPGYDCLVCATVYDIPSAQLTDDVYNDLCAAMLRAFGVAKQAAAAESYVPAGAA